MDIIKFVDGMLPWLKKEVNSLLSPLESRLSTLEKRQPEKGDKGDSVDEVKLLAFVEERVAAHVAEIPPAKDGENVDPHLVKQLVAEEVAKIPRPENGRDADPEFIKSVIAQEVSKIPPPEKGKDADIEQIKALIVEEVAKIPPPKDGEDADLAEIKQFVVDHVATLPVPKDGKDVGIEVVKTMVAEAVAQIPVPENGKDADIEVIKALIQKEVAAIPKPLNGKDADPEQIENLVNAAVAKIPPPKNGQDADLELVKGFIQKEIKSISAPKVEAFTLEQVHKMVADAVAAAIASVPPAKDGEDGKDALAIQILPAIDEAKSYPRGTYALHKNGTWRAYQKTVGMKGWECVQAGVADIAVEMPDERTITIKSILSNGETQEKTLALQNTIYKGVYQEGVENQKGDLLTWGGSIWHCNEPTTERPREGHKSWTLAVKKGRDYREPVKSDFNPNKPVKM